MMKASQSSTRNNASPVVPLCPLFGECAGCSYQDISYDEELSIKEKKLKDLLNCVDGICPEIISSIIPSPKVYHYRHRIDLRLLKTKNKDVFVGFTPSKGRGVIPIEQCVIAEEKISGFIRELKELAIEKLPDKYRLANLVVRSGQGREVRWGGIGRKSLRLDKKDYFYCEIQGRKIFYSLDTFFQANHSILPLVFKEILALGFWDKETTFLDLYGGVGLFSVGMTDHVGSVYLIENNSSSIQLAQHNKEFHNLKNMNIIEGTVEDTLSALLLKIDSRKSIAMIDPPRAGLSQTSLSVIKEAKTLRALLYLSCRPESLARDLQEFVRSGWKISKVIPFDFFPRTVHLETLAVLLPEGENF